MVDQAQGIGAGPDDHGLDIRERALEIAATAREQFSGGTRIVREYIVKEPTKALAVALGMGVILGWLIKRR